MKIQNTITSTNPCILHAYGASHLDDRWQGLVDFFMKENIVVPGDVTVMSFFYGESFFALKDQLIKSHIPFIDASDDHDISVWQHRVKIKMVADAMVFVKTKYVLILDGIDVLIGSGITTVIEDFKKLNCKLLYNACAFSHALSGNPDDFDKGTGTGLFDKLNTGAFIGETEFVSYYYNELMKDYDEVDMPVPETDGIRVGLTWQNYPEIKVDYNCDIFQTLLGASFEIKDSLIVKDRDGGKWEELDTRISSYSKND